MCDSLNAGLVGFGHLVHAAYAARKLNNSRTGDGFDETDLLEHAENMLFAAQANSKALARVTPYIPKDVPKVTWRLDDEEPTESE